MREVPDGIRLGVVGICNAGTSLARSTGANCIGATSGGRLVYHDLGTVMTGGWYLDAYDAGGGLVCTTVSNDDVVAAASLAPVKPCS